MSNNEQRHLVFVYGTLKGMDRTRFHDAIFKGRAVTLFDHWLMWGGSYPVVISSADDGGKTHKLHGEANGHVQGEVFEVSSDTLKALDRYEGVPSLYDSIPVALKMEDGSDSLALMYIGIEAAKSVSARPIIRPSSGRLYWPYPAEYRVEPL